MAYVKPLLLAGGKSSRMGTRKELLCLNGHEPMYKQLISILHAACPESDTVFLSLRDREYAKALQEGGEMAGSTKDQLLLHVDGSPLTVQIIYDHENGEGSEGNWDIGPAAGLLSAYRQDPSASWLVAACDYPFLTTAALRSLRQESTGAVVTCFMNADGFCEPLLGIWTPDALQALQQNVEQGLLGPSAVVKKLGGRTIRPGDEQWLFNTNDSMEWQQAVEMKRSG